MKSKTIVAILLAVCLLAGGVLLWRGLDRKDSPAPGDPGQTDVQPIDGQSNETQPGETGESGQSGESGEDGSDEPTILDDDGDVVIIVPDDQESGGL